MARTIGKLTALTVTQAKRRGYYGDGGGLFLQVSATGSKSWVFRFKEAGRLREMGLGPTPLTIGLADARQRAQDCRKARLDGRDPIEGRRAERMAAKLDAAKAMTFTACAERYITSGFLRDDDRGNPVAAANATGRLIAEAVGLFNDEDALRMSLRKTKQRLDAQQGGGRQAAVRALGAILRYHLKRFERIDDDDDLLSR